MRRWVLRSLFFLVVFPAALAPVELFVRQFKGVGEARRDTEETSFLPVRMRGGFKGEVAGMKFETNRWGFRGEPEFPIQAEQDELRVLSLGDSVAVGFGMDASASYVKVAERQLAERYPDRPVRVINAAGQGYSPSGYLAYLKHEGMQFSPDAVIASIELCNDVTDEALLRWGSVPAQSEELDTVRGGRYVIAWDGTLLGTVSRGPYLFEKTYTYTLLLRRVFDALYGWFPTEPFHGQTGATYFGLGFERWALDQDRIEEGWKRLFAALGQTRAFLDERRVPFVLLILPSRHVFQESGPEKAFSQALLDRAVAEAKRIGVRHLEFQAEMASAGGASRYFDFAHPDQEGHRVIGEKVASELMRVFEDRLGDGSILR